MLLVLRQHPKRPALHPVSAPATAGHPPGQENQLGQVRRGGQVAREEGEERSRLAARSPATVGSPHLHSLFTPHLPTPHPPLSVGGPSPATTLYSRARAARTAGTTTQRRQVRPWKGRGAATSPAVRRAPACTAAPHPLHLRPTLPTVLSLSAAAPTPSRCPLGAPQMQTWTTTTGSCATPWSTGSTGCTRTWASRAGASTLCAATRQSTAESELLGAGQGGPRGLEVGLAEVEPPRWPRGACAYPRSHAPHCTKRIRLDSNALLQTRLSVFPSCRQVHGAHHRRRRVPRGRKLCGSALGGLAPGLQPGRGWVGGAWVGTRGWAAAVQGARRAWLGGAGGQTSTAGATWAGLCALHQAWRWLVGWDLTLPAPTAFPLP